MKTAVLIAGFLMLAGTVPVPAAEVNTGDIRSVEVYPMGVTEPDVLEQTVRDAAGPGANVVMDRKGGRLIVHATADAHARIRDLLDKLYVPPRNVRIDVQFNREGEGDRFEAGVSGGGAVIVRDGEVGGRARIEPRLRAGSTTTSGQTVQTLLTASGGEAVLRVGESVPYLDYVTSYHGRYGVQTTQRLEWQDVGSYLYIQPTVLGDGETIRVRLTPALSGRAGGEPHRVRYNELATEVIVRDGETIRIGGLDEHSDFYSRFLVGVDKGGERRNLDVSLTPRIVGPGAP